MIIYMHDKLLIWLQTWSPHNLIKGNKFNGLSTAELKMLGNYAAKTLEPPELPAKLPREHWKQPEELLRARTLLTRPAEHSCQASSWKDEGQYTFQMWITGSCSASFDESAWHVHAILSTRHADLQYQLSCFKTLPKKYGFSTLY